MKPIAALPFTLTRSAFELTRTDSGWGQDSVTTTERVHGLLRLEGERVVLQWRVAREVQRWGQEIRKQHEMEPVREVEIPLSALAGARVQWRWARWPPGRYLLLTGADLRAFEEIAGLEGFAMSHPAQLELGVRRADLPAAQDFAGELELVLADRALRAAEEAPRLPGGEEGGG
jgi:hypothetical protein